MKVRNQIVLISGILALLAIATLGASNNVQIAKANFGQGTVSGIAHNDPHSLGTHGCDGGCNDGQGKGFGSAVSDAANKNK